MKHFIQEKHFGCGVYAIANVFQWEKFITKKRLIKSKKGNNIGQLSKWLQSSNMEIYINVLYYCTYEDMIPEAYFEIRAEKDVLPLLLSVQKTKNSLNHLISIRVFPDLTIQLHDSTRPEMQEMEFKDLAKEYEVIKGMYSFNNLEGGEFKAIDLDIL